MPRHDHSDSLERLTREIVEAVCDEFGDDLDEHDYRVLVMVAAPCGCLDFYGRGVESPSDALGLLTNAVRAVVEGMGGTASFNLSIGDKPQPDTAGGAAS